MEEVAALARQVPTLSGLEFRVFPLGGGITNSNYRLDSNNGEVYVLRVGGENSELLGINRFHEYECSLAAAGLGVGPKVVAGAPQKALLVSQFIQGEILTAAEAARPGPMRQIVRLLRLIHDGPAVSSHFSPFNTVMVYRAEALKRGCHLPSETDYAFELFLDIQNEVGVPAKRSFCHNDLLPANLISEGDSLWMIDWEYAGMGDLFFDLGNLAINCEYDLAAQELLLKLYFGEVRSADWRRFQLMRLVSDMRECMWAFVQSTLSTLDFDYFAYGSKHLHRFLTGAEYLHKRSLSASI